MSIFDREMTIAVKNKEFAGASRHGTPLPTPSVIRSDAPLSPKGRKTVESARRATREILYGRDPRLLVVVGPCSVHDPIATVEYSAWLRDQQRQWIDELLFVMRAYVEKPRTRFGWSGLINDPVLDGSGKLPDGLRIARQLFVQLHEAGTPAATEFVDVMTAPFLADTVSWAAIGARTAGSPIHRQLASGLPCPVGFKNSTDGNWHVAIDGVAVARTGHAVLGIDDDGRATVEQTSGNDASHIILRGGSEPNHHAECVAAAAAALRNNHVPTRLLIDCSHGNANQPGGQITAFESVVRQIRDGSRDIMGVMLESNLVPGCQQLGDPNALVFGQSITDPCLGLDDTKRMFEELAHHQRQLH